MLTILGHHDSEGIPGGCGTACPANAMDVVLGMLRHVVVDDMADVGNVQSTRGDVGGDQNLIFSIPEAVERAFPLGLGSV